MHQLPLIFDMHTHHMHTLHGDESDCGPLLVLPGPHLQSMAPCTHPWMHLVAGVIG